MARVTIDSGALCAQDRFNDIPKQRWRQLVSEKRNFLRTNIAYDCRCLVEFCEEAELVWQELEFESAADMIRNGYELDPVEIDLAVAWLKHNEPTKEIGLDAIKHKVQEAREKPLLPEDQSVQPRNPNGRKGKESSSNSTRLNDRSNTYTLRRLARDAPEFLDKIEAGELSVNAAAIAAGIRKKPTPTEICVKAFKRADDRLAILKAIASELEPHEAAMMRDFSIERLS
jgi:hypothetical protein